MRTGSPLRRWFESFRRPSTTYERITEDCRRELAASDAELRRLVDETANYRPRGPMFPIEQCDDDVPDNPKARQLELERRACEAEYLARSIGAA